MACNWRSPSIKQGTDRVGTLSAGLEGCALAMELASKTAIVIDRFVVHMIECRTRVAPKIFQSIVLAAQAQTCQRRIMSARTLISIVLLCACSRPAERAPTPPPLRAVDDADIAQLTVGDSGPGDGGAAMATVTIGAVGDLMLGSTYPDTTGSSLPPRDGADLLADVAPLLQGVDIAFGNLEAPLFDGGNTPTCTREAIAEKNRGRAGGSSCWAFRMPERYGALLRDAGFDVVSIANNHIDDFGVAGRARTIEVLDKLGIAWSGPTGTVAHLHAHGKAIDVIAFATYAGLSDLDDHEPSAALVAKSAKTADLVIVSFHGGAEGESARHVPDAAETFYGDRRGAVKSFAHAMVDAGADLVVGHGPHVVRGMEVYRDRLIAYSLGTFASYRGIGVSGLLGLTCMLEVELGADGRFVGGRIHAVRQTAPGGPRRDTAAKVVPMVRELSIADFGERAVQVADDGSLVPR
jgi:hypothetical protein